ncbi:MAG: DUF3298 and DUF4163 domain-containing protein [Sedimentibacter sp.]|uniref:DUF3298 and DUF4163 domain-containing protein n=1 Tax=Sedimentibacter sp. TaxID=1960295 RepID=UPI0031586CA2
MKSVQVKIICLEDNLYFEKQLLLHYRVEYPQLYDHRFQRVLNRLNNIYKKRAWDVLKESKDIYFAIAANYYIYSVRRNIPVRTFEVYYIPEITFNQDCAFSLYYDKYVYTGGAHGQTVRTSDTWDLNDGKEIYLCDMFVNHGFNMLDYLRSSIGDQIQANLEDEHIYFDNHIENVAKYLCVSSFYLKPEGIVIYFQEYEIAPYAAGIPEFLIPYRQGVTVAPSCYGMK